jgi:hypothetical protein
MAMEQTGRGSARGWRYNILHHAWGAHAAVSHINNRDCAIVSGCEDALRVGEDEYISISSKVRGAAIIVMTVPVLLLCMLYVIHPPSHSR